MHSWSTTSALAFRFQMSYITASSSHVSAVAQSNVVWATDASNGRGRFSEVRRLEIPQPTKIIFYIIDKLVRSRDTPKFMAIVPSVSPPQYEVADFVFSCFNHMPAR
jgi:hypothetical protein